MGELQATVEFSVELHKFYNVDLFQRGFYQIRLSLKGNSKYSPKFEISLPKNTICGYVFPACITHGSVVSKTFQILYRNEEVLLNDVALFRVHLLIDGHKIAECLKKAEFQLQTELWFTENEFGPNQHNGIDCVNTRILNVHFNPYKGIHHHLPVIFDYFHLCAVTVTVHGTLVSVHQPYIRRSSTGIINTVNNNRLSSNRYKTGYNHGGSQSTLESVLFTSTSSFGTRLTPSPSSPRLTQARFIHREICSLLLSAYESLQKKLMQVMKFLPPKQQIRIEYSDCFSKLHNMYKSATETMEEDELVAIATSDIAQLCAENVILWQQFMEVVTLQEKIRRNLARDHHIKRVKRFAEAFFIIENARHALLACNDASVQKYSHSSDALRSSKYYNNIPPLEIECASVDGDSHSFPIIYEDHYQEITTRNTTPITCPVSLTEIRVSINNEYDSSSIHSADSMTDSSKLTRKNSLKNKLKSTLRKSSSGSISSESSTGKQFSKSQETFRPRIKLGAKTSRLFKRRAEKIDTSKSVEATEQVSLTSFKKMESSKSVPHHLASQNVANDKEDDKTNGKNEKKVLENRRKTDTEVFKHCSLLITDASAISMPDICQGSNTSKDIKELFKKELGKIVRSKRSRSMPELNIRCDGSSPSDRPKDPKKKQRTRKRLHSTPIFPVVDAYPVITNNPLPITNSSIRISGSHVKITRPETKKESYVIHHKVPDPLKKVVKNAIMCDNSLEKPPSPRQKEGTSMDKTFRKLRKQKALHDSIECDETGAETNKRSSTSSSRPNSFDLTSRQVSEDLDMGDVFESNTTSSEQNPDQAEPKTQSVQPVNVNKPNDASFPAVEKGNLYEEIPPLPPKEFRDPLPRIKTDPPNDNAQQEVPSLHLLPPPLPKRHSYTDCMTFKNRDKQKLSDHLGIQGHARSHSVTITSTKQDDGDVSNGKKSLVKPIKDRTVDFIKAKEEFKQHVPPHWLFYSDFSMLASTIPYFQFDGDFKCLSTEGVHLVVCVHGLDGNSADLRLVRTYLELGLPGTNFEFLMSERNQGDTFADFETMTDRLVNEFIQHIEIYSLNPSKISFIGHSLGNIIIRSTLAKPEMKPYLAKLYSFLSLSGPHLGTLYNSSGLVNMGMWFMQKWKKSGSLLQLAMKDTIDIRQSFLYRLSQKPGLEYFKHVLMFGSSQDRYVPVHSARIEMCKSALKDNATQGAVYREMVTNLLRPLLSKPEVTFIRYDVHHALQSNSANSLIGRAAHIAVLDSELFIEKFMVVCGLKYFS